MSGWRANLHLIKLHRSYAVDEAARTLGVHKNTVLGWTKAGLQTVDNARPKLILGTELRCWLEKKRKASKRPCAPGTLYCFKCRAPKSPALDMVEYKPINCTSGNLMAFCGDCGTTMHRRTRMDAIATVMPNLAVQIRQAKPSIIGRTCPSLNCDKLKDS